MTGNPTVVFVAGCPRSGSTLLGRLLALVDGVLDLGEVRNLWWRFERGCLCGCDQRLDDCRFWAPVVDAVRDDLRRELGRRPSPAEIQHWHDTTIRRRVPWLLRQPGHEDGLAYVRVLQHVYHRAAEHAGARVVVDTSKLPADALASWLSAAGRVRYVHLVRDPRAVVLSRQRRRPHQSPRWTGLAKTAGEALGWQGMDTLLRRLLPQIDHIRPVVVRYEDLIRDAAAVVGHISDELGLDARPVEVSDGAVILPRSHTAAGDRRRRDSGLVALRPRRLWQQELTWRERLLITALTAPGLRRHRYPLSVDR